MRIGSLAGVVAVLAFGGSDTTRVAAAGPIACEALAQVPLTNGTVDLRRVRSSRRVHASDSRQCVGGRRVQDASGVLPRHGAADANA